MFSKQKSNLVLFILAISLFLFFVNDYGLMSQDKISIVIAIAIDKNTENQGVEGQESKGETTSANDEIQLSVELILPKAEGESSMKNVVLSSTGKTVPDCLNALTLTTGWITKLDFCQLVVISEEVAKSGAMKSLSYFLRSDKIMDSCLVTVSKGSAKSVLETMSPIEPFSAFTVEKISLQKYISHADVVERSLKTFCKNYYDEGIDNILPVTEVVKLESGNSEEEKGKTMKGEFQLFDLSSSAIFSGENLVALLNKQQTRAYNYCNKDMVHSEILVENVVVPTLNNNKPMNLQLEVGKHQKAVKIYFQNGIPTLSVDVKLKVKLVDGNSANSLISLSNQDKVPDVAIKSAQKDIEKDIISLINTSNKAGCDLFGVGKYLHKYQCKKWNKYLVENDTNYIGNINFKVNVEVESLKK